LAARRRERTCHSKSKTEGENSGIIHVYSLQEKWSAGHGQTFGVLLHEKPFDIQISPKKGAAPPQALESRK
jgi:hypothetical protein